MNDYLTQDEAARYIRLSPRTLERMRLDERGPQYTKAGRRVIYRRAILDDWLEEHTYRSTSDAAAA